MSCSPFDLRDYFLKELATPEQSQVEAHVKTCRGCREELEQLRLTEAALFSLRDEEIPQRIAFVSDPVFEPSPWRRAWTAFWGSSGRLAFAGAAMLSAALVFSTLHVRPVQEPIRTVAVAQPVSESEIQSRVDAAVARAVSASETRLTTRNTQLVAELEQVRGRMIWAAEEFERERKRNDALRIAAGGYTAPSENGELK